MGRLPKSPWRIRVTSGMKCGKERLTSNRGPASLSRSSWYLSRAVTRLRWRAAGNISNHPLYIQRWLQMSSWARQLCKLFLSSKFGAPSVPPYVICNCCFPRPLKSILTSWLLLLVKYTTVEFRRWCVITHNRIVGMQFPMQSVKCAIVKSLVSFINTLRPRQNGRHFACDIFKCIFLDENAWNLFKISLKFVHKFRMNNMSALVQLMAWRLSGAKSLSEPMMVSLLTHICVTVPLIEIRQTNIGIRSWKSIYNYLSFGPESQFMLTFIFHIMDASEVFKMSSS